jgi:hypothetical protein
MEKLTVTCVVMKEELQSDFLLQQWMTHISGHGL